MSLLKRGLAAAAIAGAAVLGANVPAAAEGGWVYLGTYNWGYCNWLGQQYADGSTGYDCRYNADKLLYDLYVGP